MLGIRLAPAPFCPVCANDPYAEARYTEYLATSAESLPYLSHRTFRFLCFPSVFGRSALLARAFVLGRSLSCTSKPVPCLLNNAQKLFTQGGYISHPTNRLVTVGSSPPISRLEQLRLAPFSSGHIFQSPVRQEIPCMYAE